MKLAICQSNPKAGDFDGNLKLILGAAEEAAASGAELAVFPKYALSGWPLGNLTGTGCFFDLQAEYISRLKAGLPQNLAVAITSCLSPGAGDPAVRYSILSGGKTVHAFDSTENSSTPPLWNFGGRKILFIDEIYDGKDGILPESLKDGLKEADFLLVSAASPFCKGLFDKKLKLYSELASEYGLELAYCNMVGGNDSLVFDGRSFYLDASARSVLAPAFQPGQLLAGSFNKLRDSGFNKLRDTNEELEEAIMLGIRDYLHKSGFQRAVISLSGGIDSVLLASLTARAIGPENLVCITMPGPYSSAHSVSDSVELCKNLGCRLEQISIDGPFAAFLEGLRTVFAGTEPDSTEENLQARIRGDILMAWSNKFGALALAAGNKSELAVGYCTLYGDMCGGLAPIADIYKTEVYALAEHLYARYGQIPRNVIDKPPSAELRPGQLDQDSLPPYDVLDRILALHLEDGLCKAEIVSHGFDDDLVARVLKLLAISEFKRRQAAPVLKLSSVAFGVDRSLPLARGFPELLARKEE